MSMWAEKARRSDAAFKAEVIFAANASVGLVAVVLFSAGG